MKHLVLVAPYFPPDGGAGTQRAVKFCKHLPACGWTVTVLTRTAPPVRGRWEPEDRSLLADAETARVIRVDPRPGIARWDEAIRQPLTTALELVLRTSAVDAVMLSMSPFSLASIAAEVRARFDVPMVFDLRDPWALDGWTRHRTRWHHRRALARMVSQLAHADLVVANTPEMRRAMLASIPELEPPRTTVVTNGFDPDDFGIAPPIASSGSGSYCIAHTGTLHCESLFPPRSPHARLARTLGHRPRPIDPRGRTPWFLLRAIAELRRRRHPLGKRIRLVCAGVIDDALRRCVQESGVSDAVDVLGYQSHATSVRLLQTADALFLPLHGLPPGERSLIVPGKTYEYFGARRPILGCVPPGDARDWITLLECGVCANPTDAGAIADALVELERIDTAAGRACCQDLSAFTRQTTARQLADALDTLTRAGARSRQRDEPGPLRAAAA